jgi:hypothetical protein
MTASTIPFKTEIVQVTDNLCIQFIYVPEDHRVSNLEVEGHETCFIGRLNQFNRIKLLQNWKNHHGDLERIFTAVLSSRGWDFNEFPNPGAFFLLKP